MKITHHTKNQENLSLNEKKIVDIKTKMNQMLQLSDEDFKAIFMKQIIMTSLKT